MLLLKVLLILVAAMPLEATASAVWTEADSVRISDVSRNTLRLFITSPANVAAVWLFTWRTLRRFQT